MLERVINELVDFIKSKWYRRSTLALFILLVVITSLTFFSAVKLSEVSVIEWIVIIGLVSSAVLFWWLSTRLPKTVKGKFGFVVAIYTESKEEHNKIASDFVIKLRELLHNSTFKYRFQLLEIQQYYANEISSREDADKILRACRGRFMVFGRAKTTHLNGQDHHVIDLNGLVLHKEVEQGIKKRLEYEFSELFPRQLMIAEEGDIFSFRFSAALINIVATYIIGIAALVSGDFAYAQQLFEHLDRETKGDPSEIPPVVKIRKRLKSRLVEVYDAQAQSHYISWRETKDPKSMIEIGRYLEYLQKLDPNNISAHILRSIWFFVQRKDISRSLQEAEQAKRIDDPTWRYNHAFLLAYKRDLKKATEEYRAASRQQTIEPRILIDLENFILWVLEREPEKSQLYYCLGLLNLWGKRDKALALVDFEKFITVTSPHEFPRERRLSQMHIQKIRSEGSSLDSKA